MITCLPLLQPPIQANLQINNYNSQKAITVTHRVPRSTSLSLGLPQFHLQFHNHIHTITATQAPPPAINCPKQSWCPTRPHLLCTHQFSEPRPCFLQPPPSPETRVFHHRLMSPRHRFSIPAGVTLSRQTHRWQLQAHRCRLQKRRRENERGEKKKKKIRKRARRKRERRDREEGDQKEMREGRRNRRQGEEEEEREKKSGRRNRREKARERRKISGFGF